MRAQPLILAVDDDEAGRYAVCKVLRKAGYEVAEAGTGESGFEMAVAKKPDLILLDIRLPDIDGFEVCRRIRAFPEIANTPVIQISASYVNTSAKVRSLEGGADAFLTKPTEPPVLIATVNSMLRMKRAEQTVLRAAQRWQSTFEAIGDGIAVLDSDGNVVQSNGTFHAMEGVKDAIAEAFAKLRYDSHKNVEEIQVSDKTFVITLHPTCGNLREVTGAVCVVADVTEKKLFDEQMQQAARLESIGLLAGGIAHDFNNLLTVILGNASLMLESLPKEAQDREFADQIVKASQSAADLTKQILAYSGKGRFNMVRVDVSRTASEVAGFVRRLIPLNVELVCETEPNLPLIEGDAGQMHQLVMNLVVNAAESLPENQKGEVRVTSGTACVEGEFFRPGEPAAPGEYVILTVSDNGTGMDQQTQERIFDPFFTTKFTGRGLGLSAVRGIVQGHRGLLRVESRPGAGTTFRLYLPVATVQVAPLSPAAFAGEEQASGTILVVDDEPFVRTFLKTALEKSGYTVLLAENGQHAVEIFRERNHEIDAVLLDFTMPVMNGEEALAHLAAIRADVPVVLSSGFSQASAELRFRGKGLAGFLGKPYTAHRLAEVVGLALASAKVS